MTKLKLNSLNVKSFLTGDSVNARTVKGGTTVHATYCNCSTHCLDDISGNGAYTEPCW